MYVESGYAQPGYVDGDNVQSANEYVESGYIESGYVEGDDVADVSLPNYGDKVKVKFFVSFDSNYDIEQIKSSLGENEIALFYAPIAKKMLMVTGGIASEFVSTNIDEVKNALIGDNSFIIAFVEAAMKNSRLVDEIISSVVTNQMFVENIVNNTTIVNSISKKVKADIGISVTMTAPDGTILATPEVQRDGASYIISVPEELSGAAYNIKIDVN